MLGFEVGRRYFSGLGVVWRDPSAGVGESGFLLGGVELTLRPIRPFDRLRAGGLGTQAAGRVKRYARGESSAVVGFFFVE